MENIATDDVQLHDPFDVEKEKNIALLTQASHFSNIKGENETLLNLKKIKKDQGKIIPYFLHSTFLLVKSRLPWSLTVSG